jgi:hypothetical protein
MSVMYMLLMFVSLYCVSPCCDYSSVFCDIVLFTPVRGKDLSCDPEQGGGTASNVRGVGLPCPRQLLRLTLTQMHSTQRVLL